MPRESIPCSAAFPSRLALCGVLRKATRAMAPQLLALSFWASKLLSHSRRDAEPVITVALRLIVMIESAIYDRVCDLASGLVPMIMGSYTDEDLHRSLFSTAHSSFFPPSSQFEWCRLLAAISPEEQPPNQLLCAPARRWIRFAHILGRGRSPYYMAPEILLNKGHGKVRVSPAVYRLRDWATLKWPE